MNATEIIARLIDSKAINGEEAICLLQSMKPMKEVFVPFNQVKEFGAHGNPYSPVYPQPSLDGIITTTNGTLHPAASTIDKEVIINAWVARDKSGSIFVHTGKPIKDSDEWNSNGGLIKIGGKLFPFPEIKWEDDKPTKVKLIIKKV